MDLLELFMHPQTYISLLALTSLEIVLGIDNIIFIAILAGKLPEHQRNRARIIGLAIALLGRMVLLMSIAWLTSLTRPLINLGTLHFSGKDIFVLLGGVFLIAKSAHEIYDKVEYPKETEQHLHIKTATMASIIPQIVMIDMIFSLDSIITAVGLVDYISIMVVAIVISMAIMMVAANPIGNYIDKHPSIKILALSFLLMIGTMLVAEGFHFHIPRGYVYFSLLFALFVEMINIKAHTRKPVQ